MISQMQHDCGHTKPLGPETHELIALIQRAEQRCLAAGQRWTPPRRRVFELLARRGAPVKAYDLIGAYDVDAPGATKPPTVYRALEFLEGQGLAHRIPSLNAYVACAGGPVAHAASFLICDCCGSAEEFEPGVADRARAIAQARGFQTRDVSVEVRGVCAACSVEDAATRAA
jgi:Fur family zinc uptake transcriptional regulator